MCAGLQIAGSSEGGEVEAEFFSSPQIPQERPRAAKITWDSAVGAGAEPRPGASPMETPASGVPSLGYQKFGSPHHIVLQVPHELLTWQNLATSGEPGNVVPSLRACGGLGCPPSQWLPEEPIRTLSLGGPLENSSPWGQTQHSSREGALGAERAPKMSPPRSQLPQRLRESL